MYQGTITQLKPILSKWLLLCQTDKQTGAEIIMGIKDISECFMMILNYRSAEY